MESTGDHWNFLTNMLHGSFGYSFYYQHRPAWDVLSTGLPYSIEPGLEVLIVTILLGVPSGIISALRSNTRVDTVLTFIAILLYSVPDIALIVAFQSFMVFLVQQRPGHICRIREFSKLPLLPTVRERLE